LLVLLFRQEVNGLGEIFWLEDSWLYFYALCIYDVLPLVQIDWWKHICYLLYTVHATKVLNVE
jgi:hypothetical protein